MARGLAPFFAAVGLPDDAATNARGGDAGALACPPNQLASRDRRSTRESRACRQRPQLGPRHLWMATQPEPAVGGRDDVLRADGFREALNPLRNQLGMLDERSRVRDDTGRQDLAGGQLHLGPDHVFVLVPRV